MCMCEYLFLLNFDVWFHSPIYIGFHIYIYLGMLCDVQLSE